MKTILLDYVSARANYHVGIQSDFELAAHAEFTCRQVLLQKRQASVVKSHGICQINSLKEVGEATHVVYTVYFKDLLKQQNQFFNEEYEEQRKVVIQHGEILSDVLMSQVYQDKEDYVYQLSHSIANDRAPFVYDRREAVRYAEQWWDSYNPNYKKFEVDCTNYVSQCLHAGGAPMTGSPNRNKGWWMKNNSWSYSWSVAHALRWYLGSSKSGLRAVVKTSAKELMLGDVICYDFQGDGRFDHNTIVVAKDAFGMPLVNAHTTNSRMRYWSYEDSTAYTPNIKYKFFHITDGNS
ncbi:amidase domain-containing protein [Bacillus sp. DJP31]|uniref:amidase domain-containing protein n=1 Tax=Bacillus sp. DJP31 TaxID=3409789 RepID=UPI003BB70E05